MTQSQVAAHLAEKLELTKKQGKAVLEELNALIVRELKKEGSLRLAGLGIFRKRKTKARMGRNPATGQEIKIPARTRLRFTAAKALKDSVRHEIISRSIFCEPREQRHEPIPAVRFWASGFFARLTRSCEKFANPDFVAAL